MTVLPLYPFAIDRTVTGTAQADILFAVISILGGGNGTIDPGPDIPTVPDNVEVLGLAGDDEIYGKYGNDFLSPGSGNDKVGGNTGTDIVIYEDATAAVHVDLRDQDVAQDTLGSGLDTLIDVENLAGSNFGDTLHGDSNDNYLYGLDGDDLIEGHAGDDFIEGGLGSDTLDGGQGNDTIWGNFGTDGVTDAATYASADSFVVVTLLVPGAQDTIGAGTDTLYNIDNLIGSDFNDTLTGNDDANELRGGDGDDHLNGSGGDDVLKGGLGSDTLNGGLGNDTADYVAATQGITADLVAGTVVTSNGTDTLSRVESIAGSEFNDVLTGDANANTLDGNGGDDSITGGAGDDVLKGGSGIDTVSYFATVRGVTLNLATGIATSTDGTDTLSGFENASGSNTGADIITGNVFNNQLLGLGGDDVFFGSDGWDTLTGGGGMDTANYANATGAVVGSLVTNTATKGTLFFDVLSSIEHLTGTIFYNDILTGNSGANVLDGLGGNDILTGGLGNDTLRGGAGTDTAIYSGAGSAVVVNLATGTATGGHGTDTLEAIENVTATAHDDLITGSSAANVLIAGIGQDEINAGAGNDTLWGDDGDDILRGDAGNDTLNGGLQAAGGDLASWFYDTGAVTADLLSGTATDGYGNTDTLVGIENLSGAAGYNSTLLGNNSANVIDGWFGDDVITGRGGADTLQGGEFSTDRFVYLASSDAVAGETITDFDAGDLIDLSAIDANAGLAGDQAFLFIGSALFSATGRGQVRFSGGQVQGDSNGDGVADMFINMTGVVAMSATDFVL